MLGERMTSNGIQTISREATQAAPAETPHGAAHAMAKIISSIQQRIFMAEEQQFGPRPTEACNSKSDVVGFAQISNQNLERLAVIDHRLTELFGAIGI
jgi:hypothetical protein